MSNQDLLVNDPQKELPPPWDLVFSMGLRFSVWVIFFVMLYLLRSFFLLVFLTFVFAYIQAHGVERLERYCHNRPMRVVFVALVFLGILIGLGSFLGPRVKEQAAVFAAKYPSYLQAIDGKLMPAMETYSVLEGLTPQIKDLEGRLASNGEEAWDIKKSPSALLIQQFLGYEESTDAYKNIKQTFETLHNIGGKIIATGSAFLLSLLFSFLIVLDLPRLSLSVKSLANTKIYFIYEEVGDTIRNFGKVLGRALEAQLFIALINAILTGVAIHFMGIGEKLAFLTVIVFLCSFIPVAGVFISSVPICLVALQESGVGLMMIAILVILAIHLIEAYILNPKIFGHHLRINPVIVLIILTMAGELFHVWGLVLGLPVCTYVFGHAIRRENSSKH